MDGKGRGRGRVGERVGLEGKKDEYENKEEAERRETFSMALGQGVVQSVLFSQGV